MRANTGFTKRVEYLEYLSTLSYKGRFFSKKEICKERKRSFAVKTRCAYVKVFKKALIESEYG